MGRRERSRLGFRLTLSGLLAPVVALGLVACGGSGGSGATSPESHRGNSAGATHPHGGHIVVLLNQGFAGNWPSGLDPATNSTGGANIQQSQAIFGGLFLLSADDDGSNAHIVGNQAASGSLSDGGKTLTIKLRRGIKFSDGTPLNAQAVIWNFERDSKSSCTCAPTWALRKSDPFTSPDPLTVVVHMSEANSAVLHNFPASSANWIASPTAFKKMGETKFKIKPVGAGPFTVVSDQLSSKLVVKANPNYFKANRPYLDEITFQSVGGDQPAYQALLAGQGNAYLGATTRQIIKQASNSSKLNVTLEPATSPFMLHFNTFIPPFNNIKARRAAIEATNWNAINKGLFGGEHAMVYSFMTPVDLFYHKGQPPGPQYNLAAAKKLVRELGGIRVELVTAGLQTVKEIMVALQTQWEKAGMDVTVKFLPGVSAMVKELNSGKWQTELGTAGAWDPATGVGIGFRFSSTSPFTGVKDKHLDSLLRAGASTIDEAKRGKIYQNIARYINDQAYGTFGFGAGRAQFAVNGLHAPGLTTKAPALQIIPGVTWGEAWLDKS